MFLITPFQGEIKPTALRVFGDCSVGEKLSGLYDDGQSENFNY